LIKIPGQLGAARSISYSIKRQGQFIETMIAE